MERDLCKNEKGFYAILLKKEKKILDLKFHIQIRQIEKNRFVDLTYGTKVINSVE